MREPWLDLVAGVLRPARSRLEHCLRERALHQAARQVDADKRAMAIADCEAKIDVERAAVLTANDGVISSRMRSLEREWLALSRPDSEEDLMELWGRIAPPAWIDRKPWRDGDPKVSAETAIALAADVDGVDAATTAVGALRAALSAWGISIGPRIRWHRVDGDPEPVAALLVEPLRAARAALVAEGTESIAIAQARKIEEAVHDAVRARLPERPGLAREIAHAAFVDSLMGAAAALDRPNPVASVRALWKTGYTLAAADVSGVSIEVPGFR